MQQDDQGLVLTSAEFIHENSKDVSVPPAGVKKAALAVYENMKKRQYSTKTWKQHPLNPKIADETAIDCERDPDDKSVPHPARYSVAFQGTKYTGYWALCACVNRAILEGVPILKTQWWAKEATDEELQHVFRSDSEEEMPMINERIRVMREDGGILLSRFHGSFVNCIKKANGSSMTLLQIITQNFRSFNDEHIFHLRKGYIPQTKISLQIYKRAQILIADIWACFDGERFGHFDDIDQITMFADYRVPQALYHLGCLEFSDRLISMLKEHQPMASGSVEEVEIRGNSIWSVELLKREIQGMIENDKSDMKVNAILLDFYIWDFAKEIQGQVDIPTHRTRSVYY
ncbi:hypothetical protein INT43_001345 [Umbelopsis isabellina]|uniref:Queuosine 5'-phosphate N-glycosylase/hydrolase n=1 Tax=Mortierella isabellina TaxID=91625 RepID=A0A8H7PKK0_MORIS|nr:hypothetical protein INT43_001345 [Umbelopsis isabellina]